MKARPNHTGVSRPTIGMYATRARSARKSVVFQHYLVDDTGAGLPEADAVFIGHRGQEIIHLLILIHGHVQIFLRTQLCLDKMVAMNG